MDKVTGTLQKKTMKSGKSYYYVVLNTGGKIKWIATGLQVNGNKRMAQRRLQEILQEYMEKSSTAAASHETYKCTLPSVECPTENETRADILFSEWVKEWLISRKIDVRECTGESYETHAQVIIEYFSEKQVKLGEITYSDIEEYCKYMLKEGKVNRYTGEKSGYAIRTVRSQKFIITSALNWAVKRGIIANNLALTVTVSRKKNRQLARKPVFFNVKEANDYLAFLKDKNDILYGLIYTTLMFGLRRSEVLGLTVQSVDFARRKLYINRTVVKMLHIHDENATKTFDSEREYPLTDELITFFKEVIDQKRLYKKFFGNNYTDNDFLFTWEDGRPFFPDYVSKHHKKMVAMFGKPNLTFHNLRHSTACILYEQGWKAKDIQEWLGHADIVTTMNIYTHIDRAHKQKQAESLSGVLNHEKNTDNSMELLG